MSIFAIADLHLGMAPDMEKPMDIFGPLWINHVERLEKNWREAITEDDTVVVAGDISWGLKLEEAGFDLDFIHALPGKKVLLKGNHDLWWSGITRLNKMYDDCTFLQYDSYRTEGIYIAGTRGWITPDDDDFTEDDRKVYDRELIRLKMSLDDACRARKEASEEEAPIVVFMHFPPVSNPSGFSGFMQIFEDYGIKNVFYGHVHGQEGFRNTIIGNYHGTEYNLISADYLNCKPIKIR